MMHVVQIPALQDNYFYLVICEKTRDAMLIDPCDAKAARQILAEQNVRLACIVNTHHHWDHVTANETLRRDFDCQIMAHESNLQRVPGCTRGLKHNETLKLGELSGVVLHTPGHTTGHISLYFATEKALFCGDTLFSGGCGRLFEADATAMRHSLYEIFGTLPDNTRVFCGHEYTLANLDFAKIYEPTNPDLHRYYERCVMARNEGQPTIPTTLGIERRINPFLRCGVSRELEENIHSRIAVEPAANPPLALFTALRLLKDKF